MNLRPALLTMTAAAALLLAVGCRTPGESGPPVLRVGVTPTYVPLVYTQGRGLVGAEVDFARALGQALGRPVEFISVPWEDEIPALLEGRTDIIMSGMSVTPDRERRIAFSDPYLGNNLYALIRKSDLEKYPTARAVCAGVRAFGVIADTTAETFVREHCPSARRRVVATSAEAPALLLGEGIDAYVDDGWAIAHLLAENEATLALAKEPLQTEVLAWGLRPSDMELRDQINEVLARWREDGTVVEVIRRWVPDIERLH